MVSTDVWGDFPVKWRHFCSRRMKNFTGIVWYLLKNLNTVFWCWHCCIPKIRLTACSFRETGGQKIPKQVVCRHCTAKIRFTAENRIFVFSNTLHTNTKRQKCKEIDAIALSLLVQHVPQSYYYKDLDWRLSYPFDSLPRFSIQIKHKIGKNMSSVQQEREHYH